MTDDPLHRATTALRDATPAAGPPAELAAATLAAIETRFAGAVPAGRTAPTHWRRLMRITRYAAIPAAAAVLAAVTLFSTPDDAVAFENVLAKIAAVEKVQFAVTSTPSGKTNSEKCKMIYSYDGRKARTEWIEGPAQHTFVFDYAGAKGLCIDPEHKRYQKLDTTGTSEIPVAEKLIAYIKKILSDDAVSDGFEDVINIRTALYKVENRKNGDVREDFRIWIDLKTELPVRFIQTRKSGEGKDSSQVELIYEDFDWSPKYPAGHFSLDPPEGYTEGSFVHIQRLAQPKGK